MYGSASDVIIAFFNNELLMMIAFIATLTVTSIDKSLNDYQKKVTNSFSALCMVYALLAFIDFGMGSGVMAVSVTVRMLCATLRNILKPLLLVLISCGFTRAPIKNKWFYVPLGINTLLFLVNIGFGCCFEFSAENEFTAKPLYWLGIAIFYLYIVLLALVLQKHPLINTLKTRMTSLLIMFLIPMAGIGELAAERNVLATAILISVIFQYEMLVVLKNNVQLKKKDENIEEQKVALEVTQKMAFTDELTGLHNRRAYESKIEEKLQSTDSYPNFTVVMCDINELKAVNDKLGHEAGDELIMGAAECLMAAFGKYGEIYRIGGDEFSIFLNCSEGGLPMIFKKLDLLCAGWRGQLVDELTISVGYASVSKYPGKDIRELTNIADKEMYQDKQKYYKEDASRDRRILK